MFLVPSFLRVYAIGKLNYISLKISNARREAVYINVVSLYALIQRQYSQWQVYIFTLLLVDFISSGRNSFFFTNSVFSVTELNQVSELYLKVTIFVKCCNFGKVSYFSIITLPITVFVCTCLWQEATMRGRVTFDRTYNLLGLFTVKIW